MKKLFLLFLLLASVPSFAQTTVAPFLSSKIQLLDNTGVVCAGCLLDTFSAGTTTPLVTYSESTGTTPNANPIVLDSAGRATVYLTSASYKFRLRSALGATLWTQDVISWNTPLTTFAGLTDAGVFTQTQPTAATGGANQSSFSDIMQGNFWNGSASAVDSWTFQNILGTGTNPTSTFTLTHSGSSGLASFSIPSNIVVNLNSDRYATAATLQADITAACPGTPGRAILPFGTITVSTPITIPSNCDVAGRGMLNTTLQAAAGLNDDVIKVCNKSNITLRDFTVDGNRSNQTGSAGRNTASCISGNADGLWFFGDTTLRLYNVMSQNTRNHGWWLDDGTSDVQMVNDYANDIGGSVLPCGANPCGSGLLIGNAPLNAVVNKVAVLGGRYDNSHAADGIFSTGSKVAAQFGNNDIKIEATSETGNVDTSIEIGIGTQNAQVIGNNVAISSVGGAGITCRSCGPVQMSGNVVRGDGVSANQNCLFIWNNGGADNTNTRAVNITDNTFTNCTGAGAHDIQLNSGTDISLHGSKTDGPSNYLFGGTVTNFDSCGNDDLVCQSNRALDYTLQVASGQHIHMVPQGAGNLGLSHSTFTPAALFHTQTGGGLQDWISESLGVTDQGMSIRNAVPQNWTWGIRHTASFSMTDALCSRDITGGIDAFCTAKASGNWAFTGKPTSDNGLTLADFGFPHIVGTPQHPTAQTANIVATNLVAAAPAGTYEVHVDCRTTTSGTGTTATFSVLWTDEGGAKTTTSSTWALNAVNSTGQVNSITVLHSAAAQNIQYSVTGTFGTSVYACDAWATRTQ